MMKRLLLFLLISTSLISGCREDEKRNDPTPTAAAVASGKLTCVVNTGAFTGDATATFNAASSVATGDANTDLLQIAASAVSTIGNEQRIIIYYRKPKGSSDTQYTFVGGRSEGANISNASYIDEPIGTITKSTQGWSGTFAVKRVSLTGGATIALEKGAFKDVK